MKWPYLRTRRVEAGIFKAPDAYEFTLHVRPLRLSVNVWVWRRDQP